VETSCHRSHKIPLRPLRVPSRVSRGVKATARPARSHRLTSHAPARHRQASRALTSGHDREVCTSGFGPDETGSRNHRRNNFRRDGRGEGRIGVVSQFEFPQRVGSGHSTALMIHSVRISARLLQGVKMGAVPAKISGACLSRLAASDFNDGCPAEKLELNLWRVDVQNGSIWSAFGYVHLMQAPRRRA
jgi:hypothetical protein